LTSISGSLVENSGDIAHDPSFKVSVTTLESSEEVILVDKGKIESSSRVAFGEFFSRRFTFSLTEDASENLTDETRSSSALEESIVISKIKIEVGSRDSLTEFRLSDVFVKVLLLNDQIEEEFIALGSKYMISTGYYQENDPLHRWAQNKFRVVGTVTSRDNPDIQESQGITEFYHPADFSDSQTATHGKIRRHWANRFRSWDTADEDSKEDSDIFFLDDVQKLELKQQGLIIDALDTIQSNFVYMFSDEFKYFLLPLDAGYLKHDLNSRFLNNKDSIAIEYRQDIFDPADVATPAVGDQSPGWQDAGFYACLDPLTTVVSWQGAPHVAYKRDHGVCRKGERDFGTAHRLFDLNQIIQTNVALTDPNGRLIQQENDPNSLSQKALDNANAIQLNDLVNRKKRYRE